MVATVGRLSLRLARAIRGVARPCAFAIQLGGGLRALNPGVQLVLGPLVDEEDAEKGFSAFAGTLKGYPAGLTAMTSALDLYLDVREVRDKK